MKVIKKINNNFALALDNAGTMIIIGGKGIGFGTPYELNDMSKITRSYYAVDTRFADLLANVNEKVFEAADQIVVYAEKKLNVRLNPNLTFTLADHIDFAIKRIKEGKDFNYGITFEMEYLHPDEMEIAKTSVKQLEKQFDVHFPKGELSAIAMHILEAENYKNEPKKITNQDYFYDKLIEILKNELSKDIDINGFNYYRFRTHVQYLLERKNKNQEINSENQEIFETIKEQYPDVYQITLKIKDCIEESFQFEIGDEEMMYLMLHINRLKSKNE